MKKPSGSCFKAGSVFLLKLDSVNTDNLKAIQASGLGERRHEGFGRVIFGWQSHGGISLIEKANLPVTKPDFSPPEAVQGIIKSIIQNLLIERIKLQAVIKQNEFVRLPSNSLISKLHSLADRYKRDQESYRAEIRKFRKIATDQMRHCLSRDHNLIEFLEKENPVEEFLRQPQKGNIKPLCQEINYDFESDVILKRKLNHAYYTTFFSMMRKRKIAKEKQDVKRK